MLLHSFSHTTIKPKHYLKPTQTRWPPSTSCHGTLPACSYDHNKQNKQEEEEEEEEEEEDGNNDDEENKMDTAD